MDPKRFENTYTYHAPKGDQTARYAKLRAKARELAELIEACCPDSREKSLAHTKVEEATMWANAAIARNDAMRLYTSKVIADWLGLTERRVRQLRDEGIIEEQAPGLYDLRATTRRYISYLRSGSLADERAGLTRAKREAAEMENALRRGELHRTEEIETGIKTMLLNIRGRFLSLPAKLSPALAAMGGDQASIFDELKHAIDETLEELRDFNVAFAQEEDGDGEKEE